MKTYTIREYAEISDMCVKTLEHRLQSIGAIHHGFIGEGVRRSRVFSVEDMRKATVDYYPRPRSQNTGYNAKIKSDLVRNCIPHPLMPQHRWYGFKS